MQKKLKDKDNSAVYNSLSKKESGDPHCLEELNDSPFYINNDQKYLAWRTRKLSYGSASFENLSVKIKNINRITLPEKTAIVDRCHKYNMAIYQLDKPEISPEDLKIFAGNFGLINLDLHHCHDHNGITALQLSSENNKAGFIPYSDKPLNWHTDGYYNAPDRKIYSVLLHCHTPARQGGENELMDHDMAYIRLRDKNPAYIEALMNENVMTIPAHIEDGKEIRGAISSPVFSTYNDGQNLHMNYSQRQRNIIWRDDPMTFEAVTYLNHLLNDDKQDALAVKLTYGQGIIGNNVLHNRSGFKDELEQSRLLYRGRFFEPMN